MRVLIEYDSGNGVLKARVSGGACYQHANGEWHDPVPASVKSAVKAAGTAIAAAATVRRKKAPPKKA